MNTKFLLLIILVFVIAIFLVNLLSIYENNVAFQKIEKNVLINQDYLENHIRNLQIRINLLMDKENIILEKIENFK